MALPDCYHPQPILAYELNGSPLDIPHGAPIRLRLTHSAVEIDLVSLLSILPQ